MGGGGVGGSKQGVLYSAGKRDSDKCSEKKTSGNTCGQTTATTFLFQYFFKYSKQRQTVKFLRTLWFDWTKLFRILL